MAQLPYIGLLNSIKFMAPYKKPPWSCAIYFHHSVNSKKTWRKKSFELKPLRVTFFETPICGTSFLATHPLHFDELHPFNQLISPPRTRLVLGILENMFKKIVYIVYSSLPSFSATVKDLSKQFFSRNQALLKHVS